MNLADVMDAVAGRLGTLTGLRVSAYPPDTVQPPAGIVSFPTTYTYDETYGRGMDRMTLPVVVVVGKVSERTARDRIAQYADGSGTFSVKAALESGTYTDFDTVRVTGVDFDVIQINAVDHLAATFTLDIAGQGA